MEKQPQRNPAEPSESSDSWSPIPEPGKSPPATKMDWIEGLPFKSERGVELLPEETVKFYHNLH